MPNTIILKGKPIVKEELAEAGLTPGDLLAFAGSGKVQRHGTAGGNAAARFAIEQDYVGDGIDTDYLADSRVKFAVFTNGDEVYALLASGANVTKGAFLESAGNGSLRAFSNEANQFSAIVAQALEDVDNSGGDPDGSHDGTTRIRVEVV